MEITTQSEVVSVDVLDAGGSIPGGSTVFFRFTSTETVTDIRLRNALFDGFFMDNVAVAVSTTPADQATWGRIKNLYR